MESISGMFMTILAIKALITHDVNEEPVIEVWVDSAAGGRRTEWGPGILEFGKTQERVLQPHSKHASLHQRWAADLKGFAHAADPLNFWIFGFDNFSTCRCQKRSFCRVWDYRQCIGIEISSQIQVVMPQF